MYLSEKPRAIDFYKGESNNRAMILEEIGGGGDAQQQSSSIFMADGGDSSSGEEQGAKVSRVLAAPKKRAETWVHEETRCLINLRREMDGMFNTSKSNKHLWQQISAKMRDRGFDRSPIMCTDKWRNLLKEFKKARQRCGKGRGNGATKMLCYKELDELLRERGKTYSVYRSPSAAPAKVDAYLQFSDKGLEGAENPFGSLEGSGRLALNLESRLDHDGHPLAITAADTVVPNGGPPWNWKDASVNDGDNHVPYGGRVILVKWGEYIKKIGIDGASEAIKEAIKSAFRLRTKRAFWLEDEDEVVRSLDRDMPLGTYILHLDEGVTIKICVYDGSERMPVHTEDKTFYTEEDFHDFLTRRSWAGLRELSGYRNVDCLDDLRPGAMYQGVRILGD